MVWYVVVWYVVVWYVVVWHAVVWYVLVWYAVVWYVLVWYAVVWCVLVWYAVVWHVVVWYGVVWCVVVFNCVQYFAIINIYFLTVCQSESGQSQKHVCSMSSIRSQIPDKVCVFLPIPTISLLILPFHFLSFHFTSYPSFVSKKTGVRFSDPWLANYVLASQNKQF